MVFLIYFYLRGLSLVISGSTVNINPTLGLHLEMNWTTAIQRYICLPFGLSLQVIYWWGLYVFVFVAWECARAVQHSSLQSKINVMRRLFASFDLKNRIQLNTPWTVEIRYFVRYWEWDGITSSSLMNK